VGSGINCNNIYLMEDYRVSVLVPKSNNWPSEGIHENNTEKISLSLVPIFSIRTLKHQVCAKLRIRADQARLLLAHPKPATRQKLSEIGRGEARAPSRQVGDAPLPDEKEPSAEYCYEPLDEEKTLEEAKLNNQNVILENQRFDGSWPTDTLKSNKQNLSAFSFAMSDNNIMDVDFWEDNRSHKLERKNSWDEIKRKWQKGPFLGRGQVSEEQQMEAAMLLSREDAKNELEKEQRFEELMLSQGFVFKKINDDGNCLFGAVADQVYGDPSLHRQLRKMCMDYMQKDRDHFSQFITEDFEAYVMRKRCDGVYGNNLEVQALSEMFARPIQVYSYAAEPLNIFQGKYGSAAKPIRISYHRRNHYNSVININPENDQIYTEPAPPPLAELEAIIGTDEQTLTEEAILASFVLTSNMSPSKNVVEEGRFEGHIHICFLCHQPCKDYEDLQVHMLTSCEKRDLL